MKVKDAVYWFKCAVVLFPSGPCGCNQVRAWQEGKTKAERRGYVVRRGMKKTNLLTEEQRTNMLGFGIGTNHRTTEADVLKVLRKKKFPEFNQKIKVSG